MQKNKAVLLLCVFFLVLSVFAEQTAQASETGGEYRLCKVLILSRHNLRSPTVNGSRIVNSLTPHSWFHWTAGPGELSMKGAQLETIMGQYFRQWLESEGLIGANYVPEIGEMRFYANSYQRTIATARYFSSGMLPMANIHIERRLALNEADPVFLPETPDSFSDEFRARVKKEVETLGGVQGIGKRLEPDAALVAEVIDFKDSEYAREKGISSFTANDLSFDIETLRLTGSLRTAGRASDALTLQYYEAEENDTSQAAFGHELTFEQWQGIARVKDLGITQYFYLPTMARQFARPLLAVMRDELAENGRRFTFLCGHDVNLATVLPSLEVEEYTLRDTIEEKTPIGTKLVIEKRIGEDGEAYASLKLVYQSAEQMQSRAPLSLEHPPVIVPLHLQGLQTNEDGLYRFDDVVRRFDEAMAEADEVA